MKSMLIIVIVALGLLLLAIAAWALQGSRWALGRLVRRRAPLATA